MSDDSWDYFYRGYAFYSKHIPLGNDKSLFFDITQDKKNKIWKVDILFCDKFHNKNFFIGEYSSLLEAQRVCDEYLIKQKYKEVL